MMVMSEAPREKARRKAKQLKRLVEELDAIRAMRLFNTSEAARLVKVLGLEDKMWEDVVNALSEISLVLVKHPNFNKIKRVDGFSTYLFATSFVASLITLVLLLLNFQPPLAYVTLLVSLILLNVSYLAKLYVSISIHRVYLENRKEIEKHSSLLKKAVESSLAKLRGELRKAGINPLEVEFKLYHSDYPQLSEVKSKGQMHILRFK